MSKLYNKPPSEIMGISCKYTAYCLDEACMYIQYRLEQGNPLKDSSGVEDSKVKKKRTKNTFGGLFEGMEV